MPILTYGPDVDHPIKPLSLLEEDGTLDRPLPDGSKLTQLCSEPQKSATKRSQRAGSTFHSRQ